jgi:hypothetical protein
MLHSEKMDWRFKLSIINTCLTFREDGLKIQIINYQHMFNIQRRWIYNSSYICKRSSECYIQRRWRLLFRGCYIHRGWIENLSYQQTNVHLIVTMLHSEKMDWKFKSSTIVYVNVTCQEDGMKIQVINYQQIFMWMLHSEKIDW